MENHVKFIIIAFRVQIPIWYSKILKSHIPRYICIYRHRINRNRCRKRLGSHFFYSTQNDFLGGILIKKKNNK